MNKPTGEEVLTLADTVASYGATRLAEVLRRSVKLEAENERLREALEAVDAGDPSWKLMRAALRREET